MRSSLVLLALLMPAAAHAAPDLFRDRTPVEMFADNVARGGRYLKGELLVTARHEDHLPGISAHLAQKDCRLERSLGRRPLYLFSCPKDVDLFGVFNTLQDVEGVRWIEASYLEEEEAVPDDLDTRQWYHANTGQPVDGVRGVEGADLGSLDAWDVTTGSEEMIILINDSGIYPDHVDLRDQIWVNADEDCTNGVDDDGNGYVDDCRGYDFGNDDNDPDPTTLPFEQDDGDACLRWHGSMIAGLAGARGGNGAGIAGVNWKVSFMNIKKHRDSSCVSTTSRSIEAVLYAMDNGAHVVSMSFSSSNYNATFEQALQQAERAGVIAVSSGGNGGRDNDGLTRYPNEYDVDNALIVVNSTNLDGLYAGSNFGARSTDVAAPGTNVMSTAVTSPNAFSFGTGSSYSAGVAAGALTLTWSAFPMLSSAEVVTAVKDGARRLPNMDCANTPRCVGLGARIDLFGALTRAAELAPADLSVAALEITEQGDGDGALEAGETVFLAPTVANAGRGGAFVVQATLTAADGAPITVVREGTGVGNVGAGSSAAPTQDPFVVSVDADCVEPTEVALTVDLADRFGRTWSSAQTLSLNCAPPVVDPGDGNGDGNGNGGDPESSGCRTSGGAAAGALLALLGLVALRRRR